MGRFTSEASRQLLAIVPAIAGGFVPGDIVVRVLASWDLFAITYLLLTWRAFRGRDPEDVRELARSTRQRRWFDGWLLLTPEQLPQSAAVIALSATVLAMPRATELGAPSSFVFVVCILAVLTAWATLHTGFALIYTTLYAEHGGGLDFPGEDEPGLMDFAYFAVAVGTSVGATDVSVTQTRMRRRVLVHSALSFLFNALILASAVAFVTTQLAA